MIGSVVRALRGVWSLRSARLALAVSVLSALGMCSVPLLGIHGCESALLLGVILPPMAAYVSTALVRSMRSTGEHGIGHLFGRCLASAAVLWLAPVSVLALDALRVRNCSPLEGFAFMLLGPGFGVALASLTGGAAGLLLPSRWPAPLLAAGIPIGTMLLAVFRFYAGPGIFAYGHFYGFFPGTLYDESIGLTGTFLSLRVVSALAIVALAALIASCTDPSRLAVGWRPRPGFELLFGCALACVVCVTAAELYSDELGYTTSTAHVQQVLGGKLASARCRIYFPREWLRRDRQRIASDCDFRVQQAEAWLGLRHSRPVDVYLFRGPGEKYALMGAEATNIAKPWRSEVYISDLGWPNPVLGHELVHAVARGAGSGPLRIAGAFGGLWPNPALIEGVAVAAAWQPQGGLTPHEWARAMLELGMIPKLKELFGAGFLGQQKRLAYTLSGSLLRFVRERWGQQAIRATYSSGSLERGVGVPIAQIEGAWLAFLRSQTLSDSALALARARFSGGGILSAVCPHTLAKLRDELHADLNAGDDTTARATCARILALDPNDLNTRATLAAAFTRSGDPAAANRELEHLRQLGAPAPFLAAVQQAQADQALRDGRHAEAANLYRALLTQPLDDDQKRLLQVKLLAADAGAAMGSDLQRAAGQRQAKLLFELLIGAPGERADGATAVYLARELRSLRSDGLAHYLEARQLFFQTRFAHAAELVREARARGLPSPELRAEALRVEGICRIANAELAEASALFRTYAASGTAARAAEAADYQARIQFLSTPARSLVRAN